MDCKLFYEQQMCRLGSAFEALKRLNIKPELCVRKLDLDDEGFKCYFKSIKSDCQKLGINIFDVPNPTFMPMPYILNNSAEIDYGQNNIDRFSNKAIARGIVELIKSENVSKNMPIVVFGKSYNVGAPIIMSLIKEGYMVKVLDSKSTKQEVQHCLDTCYWFILCANKPIINAGRFLKGSYVLDCGYSIVDGNACGNVIYDITSEEIKDKRVTISDIHNGVNLLTRIGLLYNLLDFYLGAK